MNSTIAVDATLVTFIVALVQILKPYVAKKYIPLLTLAIGVVVGAVQAYVTKDMTAWWAGVAYALQATGVYAGTKHVITTSTEN